MQQYGADMMSDISIHAPREGCDETTPCSVPLSDVFQSTHPVRGATIDDLINNASQQISIHAPREGCDKACLMPSCRSCYFNPRTP